MSYVATGDVPDACDIWHGPTTDNPKDRRGRFWLPTENRYMTAPRWLLGHLRGEPLVYGTEEACHTCDNPICVNPNHLYVGSRASNMRDMWERGRAGGVTGENARKTHCKHGHKFTPENTMDNPSGGRRCLTCHRRQCREAARRIRARRKAAA
jgi:hypothetical protein